MGDDLFREDLENVDDATTAVPVPSPLRRSPRRFPPPCPTDAGEVPVQLVDVDEVPPPLPATAAAARPPPTNQNNKSVAPLPPQPGSECPSKGRKCDQVKQDEEFVE